jgi:hypothetical protein
MLVVPFVFYLGFGIAWLLAGVLFVSNLRAWGWIAIAPGVAIPIFMNWLVTL